MITPSKLIHESLLVEKEMTSKIIESIKSLHTEHTKIIRIDEVFSAVVVGFPNPSISLSKYRYVRLEFLDKLNEVLK